MSSDVLEWSNMESLHHRWRPARGDPGASCLAGRTGQPLRSHRKFGSTHGVNNRSLPPATVARTPMIAVCIDCSARILTVLKNRICASRNSDQPDALAALFCLGQRSTQPEQSTLPAGGHRRAVDRCCAEAGVRGGADGVACEWLRRGRWQPQKTPTNRPGAGVLMDRAFAPGKDSGHQPSTCTVTVLTLWALGADTVSSPSR